MSEEHKRGLWEVIGLVFTTKPQKKEGIIPKRFIVRYSSDHAGKSLSIADEASGVMYQVPFDTIYNDITERRRENDGDNNNGDNLRNACNAGGDRQREKEEVTDELYGIHDFIVDMLCGSDLTAEERATVERIRQRVLDGIRNISKR